MTFAEVLHKIRTEKGLSQQKLADLLSEKLTAIARRTVAKYREEMGIQTASKRRLRAL